MKASRPTPELGGEVQDWRWWTHEEVDGRGGGYGSSSHCNIF